MERVKQYKIYLFDFDGTTFDTIESLYPVYRYGFHAIGIDDISDEECEQFIHQNLVQIAAARHVSKEQWEPFALAIIDSLDFPDVIDKIHPFPETLAVLKELKKRGKTIGIVSGNTGIHIKKTLEHVGFPASDFAVIMGSDTFHHGKPDPEPINLALEVLKASPNDGVVYVGDSLQDVECAKAAHVDSILVDRTNAYASLDALKVSSLEALLA